MKNSLKIDSNSDQLNYHSTDTTESTMKTKSQPMPMIAHLLMGGLLLSLMSYGMGYQVCKPNQARPAYSFPQG